jgi:hypothetical protein
LTELIEPIMRWIVAPVVAVVLWLVRKIQNAENKQNNLETELKILEAKMEAQTKASKDNHDALRATMGQVLSRLDSIDQYLRKGDGK